MQERTNPRYNAKGHASIDGVLEGEVMLKNLSITGCCLECKTYDNIKPNEKYIIDVKPESSVGVGKFDLEVECRWIHKRDCFCEIGFQIIASPKGKSFQSYVDYLAYNSTLV